MRSLSQPTDCGSEREFDCQLSDAGISGAKHLSETRIKYVAIGSIELGVVESVEEFGPKFKSLRFCYAQVFEQGNVPIINAWPMKEAALGIAKLPERFECKERSIKVISSLARVGVEQKLSWSEIRLVLTTRGSHGGIPRQGLIVRFEDSYGQAGGETCDP